MNQAPQGTYSSPPGQKPGGGMAIFAVVAIVVGLVLWFLA